MSTIKQSASVFGTRVAQVGMALVLSIIVNRIIGPQNRGVLELVSTIPVLFVNVANLGLGNAVLYFIGKKTYDPDTVINTAVTASLAISALLCALLGASYLFLGSSIFASIPLSLIVLTAAMIPMMLVQKVLHYTLLAKGQIYQQNKIQILSSCLNIAMTLLFVVLLRLEVKGAMLASVSSLAVITVVYLAAIIRGSDTRLRLHIDLPILRNSFRFGLVPFLALAVMNLIFRSDVFLVKYFLNDVELGYYGLGVSLCERIWMIPESIGVVVLMKAALSLEHDSVAATARVCRVTLWVTAACCLAFGAAAPWLIPFLYGSSYAPAVTPLEVLLPGIALISIFLVLHSDLTGRGEAKITLRVFSVFLILNVVLNVVLIPWLGIAGSALASTISYGGGSLTLALFYARRYGVRVSELLVLERRDIEDILLPFLQRLTGRQKSAPVEP